MSEKFLIIVNVKVYNLNQLEVKKPLYRGKFQTSANEQQLAPSVHLRTASVSRKM
jgi:hypothetical protein